MPLMCRDFTRCSGFLHPVVVIVGIPEIDFYLQDLENFAADAGKVRAQYDVLVFYNFHRQTPDAKYYLFRYFICNRRVL